MPTEPDREGIPERYVRLCLRVGRHVDGFVDAYIGPPEWKAFADAEEPIDPKGLHDEALLLRDGLEIADLEPDRRRWLRGQLDAIECVTARLAGDDIGWADEVERCLGARPSRIETSIFEDVHRRLNEALPGTGGLRERYVAWDERNVVPREQIAPALERLKEVLGPRAHALAPLPADEFVTYELVSDRPWIASAWYEGGHHTRIEINSDLPISIVLLVSLAAHEAYPGHHTERTAKDALLYRARGRLETSVMISMAPEAIVTEGLARIALEEALGSQPFEVVADVLADMDLRFDTVEADEVHRAEKALYGPAVNAAFMLHEDHASTEDVVEYLCEWGLESGDKAVRTVAFLTAPSSRAYISTYTDGERLCRAFVASSPGNFTRLLTEQLTTDDLLA